MTAELRGFVTRSPGDVTRFGRNPPDYMTAEPMAEHALLSLYMALLFNSRAHGPVKSLGAARLARGAARSRASRPSLDQGSEGYV